MDLGGMLNRTDDQRGRRKQLADRWSQTLVRQAEIDCLIGILINAGLFSKREFLDMVEKTLQYEDDLRRTAAGMENAPD